MRKWHKKLGLYKLLTSDSFPLIVSHLVNYNKLGLGQMTFKFDPIMQLTLSTLGQCVTITRKFGATFQDSGHSPVIAGMVH